MLTSLITLPKARRSTNMNTRRCAYTDDFACRTILFGSEGDLALRGPGRTHEH